MSYKNDKRERLVQAADEMIYHKTFNSSTLADIAALANVPLGNVYYYFKTKDEILKAVVLKRINELQALFSAWDQLPNVKDRLLSYIAQTTQGFDMLAKFGCSLGSLCQELGKQKGEVGEMASTLMNKSIHWVETQFKAMGKGEKARHLAEYFVATLQGISLFTLAFKNQSYLEQQSKNLERWLEVAA